MGFPLKRIHPSTILYFEKVLNYKVQEYAHINQVAQEITGGAVICHIIWKSAFPREMPNVPLSAQCPDSLRVFGKPFGIWNVDMFKN